jgi:hypothetical protein
MRCWRSNDSASRHFVIQFDLNVWIASNALGDEVDEDARLGGQVTVGT